MHFKIWQACKENKTINEKKWVYKLRYILGLPGEFVSTGTWVSEEVAKGGLLSLEEGLWRWVFDLKLWFGGRDGVRASCRGIGGGKGSRAGQ